MRDAERDQLVQLGDGGVEAAFAGEGADMQLVDDGTGKRRTLPELVAPAKSLLIVDAGEAVNAIRLPLTARIGPGLRVAIEQVAVVVAGMGGVNGGLPATEVRGLREGAVHVVDFAADLYLNAIGQGCPYFEMMHVLSGLLRQQRDGEFVQEVSEKDAAFIEVFVGKAVQPLGLWAE